MYFKYSTCVTARTPVMTNTGPSLLSATSRFVGPCGCCKGGNHRDVAGFACLQKLKSSGTRLERLRTSSSPSDPDLLLHRKMLFGTFVSRSHRDDEVHYLPNLILM